MSGSTFRDRRQAGRRLAERLSQYQEKALVYALPRGGVEVGAELARRLNVPLELVIARKIGYPTDPEYAIGGVTENGPVIWNQAVIDGLDNDYLVEAEAAERAEAKRRRQIYLENRPVRDPKDQTVILTDDGIATGFTMEAAISSLRELGPARLIVAAAVASSDSVRRLGQQVDELIVLVPPPYFLNAVGAHYKHFQQLSDDDVTRLINAVP